MDRTVGQIEIGNPLVEELDEATHEPALGLPLLTQKQQIVPGENAVDDLGNHGVLVAEDSGKERAMLLEGSDEVVLQFGFDASAAPARFTELGQGGGSGLGHGVRHDDWTFL